MKVLKWIGIVLLAIIVIIVVVSLFLPSKYKYETTRMIEAPVSLVFEEVNDLHNWKKWDPWFMLDSMATEEFSGPEMGKGSVRKWSSEHRKVGYGRMEIVESVQDSLVKNALYFRDSEDPGFGEWHFEETEEGTNVTWIVSFEAGFNPIMKLLFKFGEKEMEESFEKGLENLAGIAEAKPVEIPMIPEFGDIPGMLLLSAKDSCLIEESGEVMGKRYEELDAFIAENEVIVKGAPIACYHVWDEENQYTVFETAIPVEINTEIESDLFYLAEVEPMKSVEVTFRGPYEYEKFEKAHTEIEIFIEKNNLQKAGFPMEVYMVGPNDTEDPNLFVTKVVYPIMEKMEEPVAADQE